MLHGTFIETSGKRSSRHGKGEKTNLEEYLNESQSQRSGQQIGGQGCTMPYVANKVECQTSEILITGCGQRSAL